MAKIVSLDKFAKELDEYSKKNIKVFKQAVVQSMADNMKGLVESSPVDTGLYAQSWRMEVDEKRAVLGNFAPYAPMIEFGARPFTPPIRPLLEWAKRVLQKTEIDSDCWGLAKGVQNKISEVGLEPKHILADTIDKIVEDLRRNMKEKLG
jgi:hypothetical protein